MKKGQMREILRQIRDEVDKAGTVAITTHIDPDGDAVGSVLALQSFLQRRGKNVVVMVQHKVPQMYAFLGNEWMPFDPVQDHGPIDCAVVFDCPNQKRMGNVEAAFSSVRCVINIDHHVSNIDYGTLNLLDTGASSCGELLFDLLRTYTEPLNEFEMACLFVAISTDTGSFRYSNVRPHTFEIVAAFVKDGLDIARLNQQLYSQYPLKKFRILQDFLGKVNIEVDQRLGWCILTPEMLDKHGAKRADTEGFIDFIRDINEVEVAIVLFEIAPNKTKVSLRSKGQVDVNCLAQTFNGGGHKCAAGCTIESIPDDALALLKKALQDIQSC
jgi:bifunctional oligoribonuclease and PAP phosphatase NrnA